MSIHIEQIRGLVIETGLEMLKSSLVVGTWGNISARIPEENVFAITPSGVDYETIEPIDVVIIDMDGNVVSGEKKPSIEWQLHLAIYKAREDIRAIVHTHSTYATAFAIAQKGIPGSAEDLVQITGGDVRVTDYVLPGSKELGAQVVKALENRTACIMANHGCVAAGRSLKEALKTALIVEKSAKATVYAQLLGGVVELSDKDIDFMRDFYLHHYGQRE
ncbi:class II aldolase/adducin family protein [Fusibacter sp. JL216-2]|uniref:class II aldolase/adducin family protein n=1 Tax=Fusibacter sp. JL216-2 TaxID=3071453 RepID=UPI003D32FE85